jgi:hypothetical protein
MLQKRAEFFFQFINIKIINKECFFSGDFVRGINCLVSWDQNRGQDEEG